MMFSPEEIQIDPILRYLVPNPNLPEHLYNISVVFFSMAEDLLESIPRNAERTAGFRKLLEAKDCFVRAALDND